MTIVSETTTLMRFYASPTNFDMKLDLLGRDFGENDGAGGNANHYRIHDDSTSYAGDQLHCRTTSTTTIGSTTTPTDDAESEAYIAALLETWIPWASLPATYRIFIQTHEFATGNEASWDTADKGGAVKQVDCKPKSDFTSWADVLAEGSITTYIGTVGFGGYIMLFEDSTEAADLDDIAGVEPNGAILFPKFVYDEGTDCLKYTFNESDYFTLQCGLATLQDALDLLAEAYPTEEYEAGVDADGFIRVQPSSGVGAGTITFSTEFEELLGTYVADFWPPELWYEHVGTWLQSGKR